LGKTKKIKKKNYLNRKRDSENENSLSEKSGDSDEEELKKKINKAIQKRRGEANGKGKSKKNGKPKPALFTWTFGKPWRGKKCQHCHYPYYKHDNISTVSAKQRLQFVHSCKKKCKSFAQCPTQSRPDHKEEIESSKKSIVQKKKSTETGTMEQFHDSLNSFRNFKDSHVAEDLGSRIDKVFSITDILPIEDEVGKMLAKIKQKKIILQLTEKASKDGTTLEKLLEKLN